MTIQLHLTGSKAKLALVANAAAAQAWAAASEKDRGPAPASMAIPWKGFSGRGVRVRLLDPDEKELAAECAAKETGEDGSNIKYNQLRAREGLHRCIVEVTTQGELADLATATWKKVTQLDLEGGGAMASATLFTAKDLDFLAAWFRDNHDATSADFEAIMGEALEVADG
jgi:hypothetical protein